LNKFYINNERNFSDTNIIKYLSNSNYHHIIDEYDFIFSQLQYFTERDTFTNDILYWNNNYTLIQLDFVGNTIDNIMSIYQSDVSVFKQLFTSMLNYRQKTISTTVSLARITFPSKVL
jgi:hypothetical protein